MATEIDETDIIVQTYLANKRELIKYQREYKSLLDTKLLNRKQTVVKRSILNNLQQLRREKEELKTQLYVVNGTTHVREYNKRLDALACHVACQDNLTAENDILKNRLQTMEKQIKLVERNIYNLNRKTIPDSQQIVHAQKSRKLLDILENQTQVSKLRESKYCTQNEILRGQVIDMLQHRSLFNKFWHKMINQLNNDKKYLVDLVENAIGTLDNAVDVYQKFNAVQKKKSREMELRKQEMQTVLQKLTMNSNNHQFLVTKAKNRILADLEPREYKRRQIVRTLHQNKISLYTNVIQRVLSFSGVQTVAEAIEKFKKQESLYYSYFNYANELTYKMANLNNSINDLYKNIEASRTNNEKTLEQQENLIAKYRKQLIEEQKLTDTRIAAKTENEQRLNDLLKGFLDLFNLSNCDPTPLTFLLGDHKRVTIFNVKRFLKILETRLNNMVALIYVSQKDKIRPANWIVRSVIKEADEPTDINEIVLVQQCPECAEAEDVNPYDSEYVEPQKSEQIKAKLREKVPQPEMQYRLHSLSQCRLPRSRLLAAKKN